jgi:hypothetical protein
MSDPRAREVSGDPGSEVSLSADLKLTVRRVEAQTVASPNASKERSQPTAKPAHRGGGIVAVGLGEALKYGEVYNPIEDLNLVGVRPPGELFAVEHGPTLLSAMSENHTLKRISKGPVIGTTNRQGAADARVR